MNPNIPSNKSYIIVANWKMNTLVSECKSLAIASTDIESPEKLEIVICPPFTHLSELQSIRKDGVRLGAQNCHDKSSGAFTGEISAAMLVDLNCDYVIIGHSERRMMNPNENGSIHSKLKAAMSAGLNVIYCCGESNEIRAQNNEMNFIAAQLQNDLFELNVESLSKLTIAYEPIWAIGTGKHASPEQAQAMHAFIRNEMAKHFGEIELNKLRILYGGSVNASNVKSFAMQEDIDGVLVGGASLIPSEFKAIIKAFTEST